MSDRAERWSLPPVEVTPLAKPNRLPDASNLLDQTGSHEAS